MLQSFQTMSQVTGQVRIPLLLTSTSVAGLARLKKLGICSFFWGEWVLRQKYFSDLLIKLGLKITVSKVMVLYGNVGCAFS